MKRTTHGALCAADRDLLERLEFLGNETSKVIPEEIEQVADLAHARICALLNKLEEHRYADIEHEHLGCPVAKTGIYAKTGSNR